MRDYFWLCSWSSITITIYTFQSFDFYVDYVLLVSSGPDSKSSEKLDLNFFYRYEAITDASIQIYAFLNKLKIVFFIVTIVIILVQIVLSILAVYESFNNIIPLAVIFIVISAGFLAFYVVTAIRISKRIKKALAMTAPDEDKMQNLKTVSTMHHLILKYCLIIII